MSRLAFFALFTLFLSVLSVFAIPAPTMNTTDITKRSSGSDREVEITYFYQNGNPGACGDWNEDSTPLVALPTGLYANGAHCGKWLMMCQRNWKECKWAKVADECPTCGGDSGTLHIDCSTGMYNHFGSEETGVLPVVVWAPFDLYW